VEGGTWESVLGIPGSDGSSSMAAVCAVSCLHILSAAHVVFRPMLDADHGVKICKYRANIRAVPCPRVFVVISACIFRVPVATHVTVPESQPDGPDESDM